MKSYTDLEQSKKLAEILPLESADMFLALNGTLPVMSKYIDNGLVTADDTAIPCWSLAALIGVLPPRLFDSTPKRKELYLLPDLDKSYCFYRQFAVKTKGKIYLLTEGECLVDTCVEMIIKLHEQNIL